MTKPYQGRHFHHWLLFLILLLTFLLGVFLSSGEFTLAVYAVLGFACGAALTGLRFRDWKNFHAVTITPTARAEVSYQKNV